MSTSGSTGSASGKPVIIDPRLHDAVIFELDCIFGDVESTTSLVHKLTRVGIKTAIISSDNCCELVLKSAGLHDLCSDCVDGNVTDAMNRLGVDPQRAVFVQTATTAHVRLSGGCALLVALSRGDPAAEPGLVRADVVVGDLAVVDVRTDVTPRTRLPNALEAYGQLIGGMYGRQPLICLDFDGTVSEIVTDPDAAVLVDGAATVLENLTQQCVVAVLSGRDAADIRGRIGLPGVWYAGSHGFELLGPGGRRHQHEAAAASIPLLKAAAAALSSKFQSTPGVRVEAKRFALAVHYRNAAPEQVGQVIAATRDQARSLGLRVTTGRKVIELRPDVDWNKGTALGWIREHIKRSGRLLPIYVGDDLTDEDAFDAVRFDGIGIVVRHSEDDGRPTSARFSVQGPEQACELLRRVAEWLAEERISEPAWTYRFEGYEPHSEKLREALCTVGNGYFATRGCAPECQGGQTHYPGTYAAGVYNRLDDVVGGAEISNESLVNLPNWLPVTFRMDDGDWFDVDAVTVLSYRQTLDLHGAVLHRQLRFRDAAGRTTAVSQQRFVAMHNAHVAALQTVITAEDWSGGLQIRSMLDGHVRNALVERYRELASNHLGVLKTAVLSENSVLLTTQTTQSRIPVALAARTTLWLGQQPAPATYRVVDDEEAIGHDIHTTMEAGESLWIEKVVTLVTGRDVAISEPAECAARILGRQPRFAEILGHHVVTWAHLWQRLSIEFTSHTDELRILRLHLLHLLQTVSSHSEAVDTGVPARGLHGEAYRGHVFWDELFIFSVLNMRIPMITRSLLRYRYRRLPEARRAAVLAGYRGAMFPWQSGSDGREESPRVHVNPRSGRWHPDPSHLAHHIGLAIAYNVWQFYQVTGDLAYLIDFGAELLLEIARFWASRSTYDADLHRYVIRGVIGPDEFHSGYPDRPYAGVDNNAYTNVMVVWVMLHANELLELLPLRNRLEIREKLGLTDEELANWDRISRRMLVPFHDGVISQFEGYEQLSELDWGSYRSKYGDIARLDRILDAEQDDINRYQASKQADALMLLYLLSSDELRELLLRLGYHFAPEQIPKMVDYYLSRTSHGSTLSAVVHTWVLARANRDQAAGFFTQVLKSDIADIQGGTTSEGIHLAAMAGSVDLMQRCFTGLEIRDDRLVLSPNWPASSGVLSFPIRYRGLHIHVRVSGRSAELSVDPSGTASVTVECRGRVEELAPGRMIQFWDGSERLT